MTGLELWQLGVAKVREVQRFLATMQLHFPGETPLQASEFTCIMLDQRQQGQQLLNRIHGG